MAITRTQIAKQLLEQGGRAGFQGGGADTGKERGFKTGRAPGPVGGGGGGRNPMAQFGKTPEEVQAVKDAAAQSDLKKTTGLGDFLGVNKVPFIQAQVLNKILNKKQLTQNEINRQIMEKNLRSLEEEEDLTVGGDGPSIFLPELPTQAPSITEPEPELSELQQMIADTPRFRFAADGGRIGFRGGDAARSDAASGRDAGRADPSGGVADRGSDTQDTVQYLATQGFSPKEIRQYINPNIVDKIQGSRFNNPLTRGIFRTGAYLTNPTLIGGLDFRKAMQVKNLYDVTKDSINNPNVSNLDDDDDQDLTETIAENVRNMPDFEDKITETKTRAEELLKEMNMANGGRAGLAEGGMPYEGGIMDLESARQMYGLGKLVKKVTRTVKKIAKSPIGKAALLYTGVGGLGNMAAGQSFFSNFASPSTFLGGARNIFSGDGIRNILVGRPESIISPKGGDIFRQAATSGILGTGGKLDALKAISGVSALSGLLTAEQEEEAQLISDQTGIDIEEIRANPNKYLARRFAAEGGSMDEPVAKKTMPLLDMDGKEMDLRAEGGFVPIGRMEKADDVPARLSKNEFVFTADAVRNAGDGDVDKGAEVMYNMMKNLESGGDVSEESQGLEGARKMFQTSQRLEEVL